MEKDELIKYLANVILVCQADSKIEISEGQALKIVLQDLQAGLEEFNAARELIRQGYDRVTPVGRFSTRVRNLEDMTFVSLADEDLPHKEKEIILNFAQTVGVSQKQMNMILADTRERVRQLNSPVHCPSCGEVMEADAIFCPFCGIRLPTGETA